VIYDRCDRVVFQDGFISATYWELCQQKTYEMENVVEYFIVQMLTKRMDINCRFMKCRRAFPIVVNWLLFADLHFSCISIVAW